MHLHQVPVIPEEVVDQAVVEQVYRVQVAQVAQVTHPQLLPLKVKMVDKVQVHLVILKDLAVVVVQELQLLLLEQVVETVVME